MEALKHEKVFTYLNRHLMVLEAYQSAPFQGAKHFYSHKTSIFREWKSCLISIVHIGLIPITGITIKRLLC